MRKIEIIHEVVRATGVETADVELIVEATLKTIKDNVKAGRRVDFRGFGSFYPKMFGPKKGRRPLNGNQLAESEMVEVPARVKPVFKPSKKYFACSTSQM